MRKYPKYHTYHGKNEEDDTVCHASMSRIVLSICFFCSFLLCLPFIVWKMLFTVCLRLGIDCVGNCWLSFICFLLYQFKWSFCMAWHLVFGCIGLFCNFASIFFSFSFLYFVLVYSSTRFRKIYCLIRTITELVINHREGTWRTLSDAVVRQLNELLPLLHEAEFARMYNKTGSCAHNMCVAEFAILEK